MNSKYFDRKQFDYGVDSHCNIKLGATYVFGFGKHVKQNNEASRQNGAGSAILEQLYSRSEIVKGFINLLQIKQQGIHHCHNKIDKP